MKNGVNLSAQTVLEKIKSIEENTPEKLTTGDSFCMPLINIEEERSIKQLNGLRIENENHRNLIFSEAFECIKLKIDENGIKVENEALIQLENYYNNSKEIILNKSFWVIMKEKGQHPYLISFF